jgi:hypothetical protein
MIVASKSDLRVWANNGQQPMPAWVLAGIVGSVTPNGAFNIDTPRGHARVHPNFHVLSRKGKLWTVDPSEQADFIDMLDDEERDMSPLFEAERAAEASARLAGIRHARTEADVADRADDTDDISARIALRAAGGATVQPEAPVPSEIGRARRAPALKLSAPLGIPPSVELRPTADLLIDDSYQRSIDTEPSQKLIRRIAIDWDWRMCLPLVVSRRDDGFYVIDGQHRLAAAQLRRDIPFLPCCVSTYAGIAEEASMFVAMNRTRRPINRLDDFHAATAGGDEDALTVRRIIIDAGFKVARKTGSQSWVPGEVAFTTSIEKVLRKHGEKVCANALTLMAEAFPDEVLNAGASVFLALTKLAVAGATPDRDRLFRALLTYDQKGWASFLLGIKGGVEDRALALRSALSMAYDDAGLKGAA